MTTRRYKKIKSNEASPKKILHQRKFENYNKNQKRKEKQYLLEKLKTQKNHHTLRY